MRNCKKCGIDKNVSEFYFNGYKKNGDRNYRPNCRECEGKTSFRRIKPEIKIIENAEHKSCIKCGEFKLNSKEFFENGKNICHECRKNFDFNRREKLKKNNPIFAKCLEMATSAHARVFAPSRTHKKGYRNLEKPFDFSSTTELAQFIYEKFGPSIEHLINENKRPSLDRIDPKIGYTRDNIRILEFVVNTLNGVENKKAPLKIMFFDGRERQYASIQECSESENIPEVSIRWALNNKEGFYPKKKCIFVRLKDKIMIIR